MKTLAAAVLALTLEAACAAPEGQLEISRASDRSATVAPSANFTGAVRVETIFKVSHEERTSAGKVIFSPGARTHWHTHPLGQTLIVTSGIGLVQREGGPIERIREGDVVRIPANVRHWHGAAPDSAMSHIAIAEAVGQTAVTWMEPVSDAQYGNVTAPASRAATTGPSRAQQLLAGVAPKLAQLTDDVLYGDVWQRPGLSPRDRSLATVSALIALNRPDQLRSHLTLARRNGLTESELSEALTHLAFYAGWPSAVTAAGIAREVFASTPGTEASSR